MVRTAAAVVGFLTCLSVIASNRGRDVCGRRAHSRFADANGVAAVTGTPNRLAGAYGVTARTVTPSSQVTPGDDK
jgi:hypothetical protein